MKITLRIVIAAAIVLAVSSFAYAGKSASGGSTGKTKSSYSVGGTVSGLSGTLVLQESEITYKKRGVPSTSVVQALTITASGAFNFGSSLANGTVYNVAVSTQPTGQTCTVGNGSGTISGANVNNIPVYCWTTPVGHADNLSYGALDAKFGRSAMNGNGDAVLIWEELNGAGYTETVMSQYQGGVWTTPATLSDINSQLGHGVYYSHVAMDNNGDAIAVWGQWDGIYKTEYRGGGWSHPDKISPLYAPANSPRVAMDDNGNAIVVWAQNSDAGWQIYKSEYRNGAWTHPSSLADNISPDGRTAYFPAVAMDNNGNAIIAWQQYNDSYIWQIFKSEYREGAWTHPSSLADNISPDGRSANFPVVAMDNNGNAIIVWQQNKEVSGALIYKAEYRGGVWTYPSSLTDSISQSSYSCIQPQVAMDNNGNAIVVWASSDNNAYRTEFRAGVWSAPVAMSQKIVSTGGQYPSYPNVTMGNNGDAVITWEQSDGIYYQIYKSQYHDGIWADPAGATDKISPNGLTYGVGYYGYNYLAQAMMDDYGNAIITWWQTDGSTDQIFKAEYQP